MSRSKQALQRMEAAAEEVVECAKSTLGGVGMACHATTHDQAEAFRKARARLADAETLVASIARFNAEHGSFS
jgi:hypothetical protein